MPLVAMEQTAPFWSTSPITSGGVNLWRGPSVVGYEETICQGIRLNGCFTKHKVVLAI